MLVLLLHELALAAMLKLEEMNQEIKDSFPKLYYFQGIISKSCVILFLIPIVRILLNSRPSEISNSGMVFYFCLAYAWFTLPSINYLIFAKLALRAKVRE